VAKHRQSRQKKAAKIIWQQQKNILQDYGAFGTNFQYIDVEALAVFEQRMIDIIHNNISPQRKIKYGIIKQTKSKDDLAGTRKGTKRTLHLRAA